MKLLRAHIRRYGTTPPRRVFQTTRGGIIQDSAYSAVWAEARKSALTEAQYRSPLGRRLYDLRHAAVSLWLNSGVPETEAARRAGHGVAVLLKIYAHSLGQRVPAPQFAITVPVLKVRRRAGSPGRRGSRHRLASVIREIRCGSSSWPVLWRSAPIRHRTREVVKEKMTQHVAVPLLEGAHSSADALTTSGRLSIGGIECQLLLPTLRPDWAITGERDLESPCELDAEGGRRWPMTEWGFIHDHDSVTIQAIGLVLIQPLGWGSMLIDFDHAVGLWRHQLRDWLSVIADGPTDFLELPVRGETRWANEGYTNEVWENYYDNLQWPQRVSRWQWEHVLAHVRSGDQPPLARVLLTTAKRAAATGNSRLAVIDAATAAEVALTAGLSDRLSTEATSRVAQVLMERTRMLGPRLDLAKDLGMALPDRIRAGLVERRNAVIHRGTAVTDADAHAAITAAGELVDEYQPLPAHCQDPASPPIPAPVPPSEGWDDDPPF